jgi:predicted DNA repair protein MutK
MVIALNEVADEPFLSRLIILVVVAFVITIAVYGVVGVIVKMDDVGLHLAQRKSSFTQKVGRGLVAAMPKLLATISVVGIVAMLWVGGHIVLNGLDELGFHAPYDLVHDIEHEVEHAVHTLSSVLGWLTNTACSAVFGLLLGALIMVVLHFIPFPRKDKAAAH